MELAEHAFYRSLGFSATRDHHGRPLGLPRVHAECDYRKPLRFEDLVEIHLLVQAKRPRVITYFFRFRNLTASPVVEVAHGLLTVVCVRKKRDGAFIATSLPVAIANQIEVAPAALLRAVGQRSEVCTIGSRSAAAPPRRYRHERSPIS